MPCPPLRPRTATSITIQKTTQGDSKKQPKTFATTTLEVHKKRVGGGTRKKTKKPENRKSREQVQQFRNQGAQKQNAKSRNGCTRTHRQATTTTTTDFRRKGQAMTPTLGTL